jgi:hypothetical protein
MSLGAFEHAVSHHPLSSITSRSFHPFYAIASYLGMIMPFLVLSPSRFAIVILRYHLDRSGASTLQVLDLSLSASRLRTRSPMDLNLETFNPTMN